jgi:hypothetical protein
MRVTFGSIVRTGLIHMDRTTDEFTQAAVSVDSRLVIVATVTPAAPPAEDAGLAESFGALSQEDAAHRAAVGNARRVSDMDDLT